MSSKPKILIVLTSHDKLGQTGKPTGWYLPELAHPYKVFVSYADLVIASPKGGAAPLDPSSIDFAKDDEYSQQFLQSKSELWEKTERLENYLGRASEFGALFIVGGHGPVFDLANSSLAQKLISEFYGAGKVISAVCHGPAALVNIKLPNGEYLVQDQPVTAFSNVEEDQVGLTLALPFLTESELVKNGGKYEKADQPWGSKVAIGRGGKLLTGQNPASATPLAQEVLKAITT